MEASISKRVWSILWLFILLIYSISAITWSIPLNETYVNKEGDTMTGNLSFNPASLLYINTLRGILPISDSSFFFDSNGDMSYYFRANGGGNILRIYDNLVDIYSGVDLEVEDIRAGAGSLDLYADSSKNLGLRIENNTDNLTLTALGSDNVEYQDNLYSITKNVTASYFIGDGSLLTGIEGDNSSWNETYADNQYLKLDASNDPITDYLNITGDVQVADKVIFTNGGSTGILSYIGVGISFMLDRSLHFDDNLFLSLGTGYDVTQLFNSTDLVFDSGDITANDKVYFTDFDSYNFDNNVSAPYFVGDGSYLTGIEGDNSSWNETYAGTKYVNKSGDMMSGEYQIGNDSYRHHSVNTAPSNIKGWNEHYQPSLAGTYYAKYLDFDNPVIGTIISGLHMGYIIDIDMTGAYSGDFNFPTYVGHYIQSQDSITYGSSMMEYIYNYAQWISNSFTGSLDATTSYEQYGTIQQVSGDLGTASTTIKYGDKTTITGTADDSYGYWISVTQGTNNYAIWVEAGDVILDNDNQKIRIGETQGDFDIYHDGSENVFNTTGNYVYAFYNTTGLGRIRVKDLVYSTPEMKEDMSNLDTMKNPILIISDGKTEDEFHQTFPDAVKTYVDVQDDSNCWEVVDKYCYIINGTENCYEEEKTGFGNAKLIYREECGTKQVLVISAGQGYLDNYNLIYQLKQENDMLKTELCAKDNTYSWCPGGVEL